jgi:hypothetical protein
VVGWLRSFCCLISVLGGALLTAPPAAAQDIIRGDVRPLAESAVHLVVESHQPLGQVGDSLRGPSYRNTGWAADLSAGDSAGVRQIVGFLNGPSGSGRLLGWARYGLPRPDVGTALNAPGATPSGFELVWRVADMPLQVEPVRDHTLYLYLETADGWVVARVPIAVATWADSGAGR